MNGATNTRNPAFSGKQPFLPPRCPFPISSPAYADYGSNTCGVLKGIPKPRENLNQHQRTSSESFLFEEQPSWLDDLLNEPESPLRRGHRRSSSDSFAYMNMSNIASDVDNGSKELMQRLAAQSWGYQGVDHSEGNQYSSYHAGVNSYVRPHDRGWESGSSNTNYRCGLPVVSDKVRSQSPGPSCVIKDSDGRLGTRKNGQEELAFEDPNYLEKKEDTCPRNCLAEADPKRAKQKFAQRSRVRKLQYIAELERNVQALQAEGSEVCAELDFLDQQNLILNMENKALKQRLDSLAQEQFIKHLQQETLEREIARLQALYLQQQQPQPQQSIHGRSNSRDLESQFAHLSLKHKTTNPGRDPVTGALRI